ncbi:MAG: hypothetical protein IT538_06890 [Variibacter sp.]|nr:hypothetical protein [Variibacter sp.]
MVNDGSDDAGDLLERLARQRGLALSQFPEAGRAAAARALQALPPPPTGRLTEPAGGFDPVDLGTSDA